MEDPQDSFSSARHLLLEVMAEQEGWSLLDAVLHLQSKRRVKASHRDCGNEHDCRGLVRDSFRRFGPRNSFSLRTHEQPCQVKEDHFQRE